MCGAEAEPASRPNIWRSAGVAAQLWGGWGKSGDGGRGELGQGGVTLGQAVVDDESVGTWLDDSAALEHAHGCVRA